MSDSNDLSEADFLATYDPASVAGPLLTVDAALFTYHEGCLKALVVKRTQHPEQGKWSLPGGFVDLASDRTLEDTVRRVVNQKTGVAPPYLEQLASYGNARRDKRGWAVTVCYTALMAYQDCRAYLENAMDACWSDVATLAKRPLAFDHKQLLKEARERMRQKALYSIVPAYALPELFTLPELQELHEVLIGKPLQKKSFRRRIEQANLIEDSGEKRTDIGRPATLYRVKSSARDFRFVRNLEA